MQQVTKFAAFLWILTTFKSDAKLVAMGYAYINFPKVKIKLPSLYTYDPAIVDGELKQKQESREKQDKIVRAHHKRTVDNLQKSAKKLKQRDEAPQKKSTKQPDSSEKNKPAEKKIKQETSNVKGDLVVMRYVYVNCLHFGNVQKELPSFYTYDHAAIVDGELKQKQEKQDEIVRADILQKKEKKIKHRDEVLQKKRIKQPHSNKKDKPEEKKIKQQKTSTLKGDKRKNQLASVGSPLNNKDSPAKKGKKRALSPSPRTYDNDDSSSACSTSSQSEESSGLSDSDSENDSTDDRRDDSTDDSMDDNANEQEESENKSKVKRGSVSFDEEDEVCARSPPAKNKTTRRN